MRPTRRHFLGLAGGCLGAAALPSMLVRRAWAQTATFGSVRHLIILFAQGGLRSHCLFNAVGTPRHNPYGTQATAPGTDWVLGSVCGAEDIRTTSLGTVPGFYAITSDVTVLPCVDHRPGAKAIVDHEDAVATLTAGEFGHRESLLARVLAGHPRYVNGSSVDAFPPVEVGQTGFGFSATGFNALTLSPATDTQRLDPISRDWSTNARDRLNVRFSKNVAAPYRHRVGILERSKRSAFEFAEVLVHPRFDVVGAPETEHAGVTNRQLVEVLGQENLRQRGDLDSHPSWGADVALAVRALGFGAPVAVVRRDMYDTHSREDRVLPIRSADLVRQLAGLNFLLKKMPHASGGNYFDHTLVAVVSEFSRNNTEGSGFNSGLGSDHILKDEAPMRNQAVALMGGILNSTGKAGRQIGSTDTEMIPTGEVFSTLDLHATFLALLGVGGTPTRGTPIPALSA